MEEQKTRQPYLRQIARPSEMREDTIIGPVNKIPQPIPPISESCSARMRRCYLIQAEGKGVQQRKRDIAQCGQGEAA
jgi:hypothetical protein